jgi:hypothetical protein
MTIDEELSALMDRFFRAVSFAAGGMPAYERMARCLCKLAGADHA